MIHYLLRRLALLPLTLLAIICVNFIILNLAPGDPTSVTEISPEGMATRKEEKTLAFGSDDRYLQFREHYGLTLPILINLWPFSSADSIKKEVWSLTYKKESKNAPEMEPSRYNALRIRFGDKARFIMPHLLALLQDTLLPDPERRTALRFFVRGGVRQAYLGADLSPEQRAYNQKISTDNSFLYEFLNPKQDLTEAADAFDKWYRENQDYYRFEPAGKEKFLLLFQTRLLRYLTRVCTFNFGTLRNDDTKSVIYEVTKRFKYSLTLAVLPMFITFFLSQTFGMAMASFHGRWIDTFLNFGLLFLYATPIFVVAPFLIEKVALPYHLPLSGFTSPQELYVTLTSSERLWDIVQHLCLPLIAVMYGTMAASARLSRTAVLEVYRHDYVRTARAKGLSWPVVMIKHVGRNAAITIVTSLAASLGIILSGSLIVETLFQINGFGKFFYDAVINRDYNVIMFSSLAGAFLTLMGYLARDLAYTSLDPRVSLE